MPTNYNPLGWAKKFSTAHNLMQIGDEVVSRHGVAKIIGIELCENKYEKYGIEVKQVYALYKDRCVFDLDNGHWAYGYQVDIIKKEVDTT